MVNGVVAKVVTRAITTKIVNVRVLKILAESPIFCPMLVISVPQECLDTNTYQDDQLDQPFAAHKRANGKGFSPDKSAHPSSNCSTDKLGKEGYCQNPNHICPGDAVIEQTNIGVQA